MVVPVPAMVRRSDSVGPLSSTDTIISKTVSPGSPLELGTAPVSVYGQSLCNITTEWVGTIWQIVILSTELYYLLALTIDPTNRFLRARNKGNRNIVLLYR